MLDSILIFLSATESLVNFTAREIIDQQEGEILAKYCEEQYIEFALSYIAEKSAETGKYSLNPSKVKKTTGLILLSAKGDW